MGLFDIRVYDKQPRKSELGEFKNHVVPYICFKYATVLPTAYGIFVVCHV